MNSQQLPFFLFLKNGEKMKISLTFGLLTFFLMISCVQACINPGLIKENGKPLNPFGGWLFINGTKYDGLEIEYNLRIKNINNQGLLVSLQPSSKIEGYISSEPVFVEANSIKNMSLRIWVGGKSVYDTVMVNYICEDGTPQFLQTFIYLEIKGKGISPPPTSDCDSHGLDGCYSGFYRDYYCLNGQLKYKETCTVSCCRSFGGEDAFCNSDKTMCLFPDPNEVLTIKIHSPENKTYGNNRVLINVSVNNTAKYIYYALNTNRFRKACQNCDSYEKEVKAKEGLNELRVRVENYGGKHFDETVTFVVDSKKPRIRRIYPKDGEYIKGSTFRIQYTEDNLQSIGLFYGTNPLIEYDKDDCPSGKNKECVIEIDLSSFNNQKIRYYFVIRDAVHSSISTVNEIYVDSTSPSVVIHSPSNRVYDSRKVVIDVKISEKVELLEYSDNEGRYRKLCKNCDSYSKTFSFRDGIHQLTFRATDYAGNEGYKTVTFVVDSKKPRIRRIYPKDGEYSRGLTTFTIKYDENNLQSITLFYGSTQMKEVILTDCPSGRNQQCSITVDLSEYDGKEIRYYFVIRDAVHNTVSNMNTITVDATVPSIIVYSPTNGVHENRRVLLNMSVSEKVKLLEISDNGSRFRRLCMRCDHYSRLRSFRHGSHELLVRAIDKAGNEGYASVTFIIS